MKTKSIERSNKLHHRCPRTKTPAPFQDKDTGTVWRQRHQQNCQNTADFISTRMKLRRYWSRRVESKGVIRRSTSGFEPGLGIVSRYSNFVPRRSWRGARVGGSLGGVDGARLAFEVNTDASFFSYPVRNLVGVDPYRDFRWKHVGDLYLRQFTRVGDG